MQGIKREADSNSKKEGVIFRNKLKTKVKQEAGRLDDIIPYIPNDGRYKDTDTGEGIYMLLPFTA